MPANDLPSQLVTLLSAFELQEVLEAVAEIAMEASSAHSCAVAIWDSEMESFADNFVGGQKAKDMKALLEAVMADYVPEIDEFGEFKQVSAAGGGGFSFPVSYLAFDADVDLKELKISVSASVDKALGEIAFMAVKDGEAIKALVILAANEFEDQKAILDELSRYPLEFAISRGFEVMELQRENDRLRSQYEEIEDKTSAMEEQTRKLIHDITARDSIRMKHLERERLVYFISNAVKSSVHIEEVLNMTVEKIGDTFGISRCHLLRSQPDDGTISVFEYAREGVPSVKDLFVTDQKGLAFTSKAFEKEAPENIEDPDLDDRTTYDKEFLRTLALRSGLIVPIVLRERTLGVLFLQDLYRTREWSIDDISLIGSLADNLSVAIENAELHREREKQAVTDGLTGVFNRRAFNENLQKEFERASRYEHDLSLVIVDLDFLKKINDNFGHAAGDEAIKAIGAVLRQGSRSIDFCARYGGEEFCLLLPNTTIEMAEQLAERLRRSINEVQVPGYGKISASLGVSNFPLHCNSAEDLFHKADEALYKAKEGGRNRVVVAASEFGGQSSDAVKVRGI